MTKISSELIKTFWQRVLVNLLKLLTWTYLNFLTKSSSEPIQRVNWKKWDISERNLSPFFFIINNWNLVLQCNLFKVDRGFKLLILFFSFFLIEKNISYIYSQSKTCKESGLTILFHSIITLKSVEFALLIRK